MENPFHSDFLFVFSLVSTYSFLWYIIVKYFSFLHHIIHDKMSWPLYKWILLKQALRLTWNVRNSLCNLNCQNKHKSRLNFESSDSVPVRVRIDSSYLCFGDLSINSCPSVICSKCGVTAESKQNNTYTLSFNFSHSF